MNVWRIVDLNATYYTTSERSAARLAREAQADYPGRVDAIEELETLQGQIRQFRYFAHLVVGLVDHPGAVPLEEVAERARKLLDSDPFADPEAP